VFVGQFGAAGGSKFFSRAEVMFFFFFFPPNPRPRSGGGAVGFFFREKPRLRGLSILRWTLTGLAEEPSFFSHRDPPISAHFLAQIS